MKVTKAMVTDALTRVPDVPPETVRSILEAGLQRALKPRKPNIRTTPRMSVTVRTILPDLKDGSVVIIPVPHGASRTRFQSDLKANQSKKNLIMPGELNIVTEQVVYFSMSDPEAGLFRAIKCTIQKHN